MSSSAVTTPSKSPWIQFAREFLDHPTQVASLFPSSRYLENKVAEAASVESAEVVIELGPGDGGTTRALLRSMPETSTLLAIEVVPKFAARLREWSDPRLIVHQGDACDLGAILHRRGISSADVIVSGIPFSTIEEHIACSLIRHIHTALSPSGRFVAYQLSRRLAGLARSQFGSADVFREYRNLPPLWVYRWSKTH